MESWNTRFTALDIKHLRSPAFAHPVAFEPKALVNFAIREGRTSELIDAPVCCWVPTTDLSAEGSCALYHTPWLTMSTSGFARTDLPRGISSITS